MLGTKTSAADLGYATQASLFLCETESHHVIQAALNALGSQAGLELMVGLLHQPPKC